ncbi:MAG: hypothetical protein LUE93_10310 [Bacteroides sp.]|nr:hypothetical protein [Bacteroides sp.]
MIVDRLSEALIAAMDEKVPERTRLAHLLMDILSIGKEAVYRRLRGEVPFTLSESATISRAMGISLDKLSGVAYEVGDALFALNLIQMDDAVANYFALMEHYKDMFLQMAADDTPQEAWAVYTRIPLFLAIKYDKLSKFHFYRWLYQRNERNAAHITDFQQMRFPDDLSGKQRQILEVIKRCEHNSYIWDKRIFQTIVDELLYYRNVGKLSDDTIREIKQELLFFLEELKELAAAGYYKTGEKVDFYICPINLESTYSYVESENIRMSFIKLYDLRFLSTTDELVFQNLKNWFRSLKKFSVLISQSAEPQRYEFFEAQAKIIDQL